MRESRRSTRWSRGPAELCGCTLLVLVLSSGADATPTFAVFVIGNGQVPFDPARNRIFVRFKDGAGLTRGSTSVAVRTR
jgi:hypothetical protein